MPVPSYGALPLAKTFLTVRFLSLVAMLGIVGMTANFVSMIISTDVSPPKEIIGTLSVTSIATLYTLLTLPIFYARARLGLLIMLALDSLLLIAFVVVAVVLGKPLSFLNCMQLSADTSSSADGVAAWLASLIASVKSGGRIGIEVWAASTRGNCLETKAVWGLCVALCILFTCSCVLLPILFFKDKKYGGPPMVKIEDEA